MSWCLTSVFVALSSTSVQVQSGGSIDQIFGRFAKAMTSASGGQTVRKNIKIKDVRPILEDHHMEQLLDTDDVVVRKSSFTILSSVSFCLSPLLVMLLFGANAFIRCSHMCTGTDFLSFVLR